jgi:hypothetical protein
MADDARANSRRPISAAGAHRGNAVHKLRFSDHTKRLRPVGAIHGLALHEDASRDVVTAFGNVCAVLVEQVSPSRPVPQMMMRIHDRKIRIDRVFMPACQPFGTDGEIVAMGFGRHRASASSGMPVGHPAKSRGATPVYA